MIEQRAVKPFLLAILSFVLAAQAQLWLTGARPIDGWVLYASAMILAGVAYRPLYCTSDVSRDSASPQPGLQLDGNRRVRRTLIALSITSSLAALIVFARAASDGLGWTLHLFGVLALLATTIAPRAEPDEASRRALRAPGPNEWREWSLLALILLVALSVRVWQNDAIPAGLWFDEAREAVMARRVLADSSYRPVYMDYIERPAHHVYLVALAFALFGESTAALRLTPALFGVLNTLTAYLLFRRWFGSESGGGLIAAALTAVLRYDLIFSRIVFDANTTPFFMMLTLFFLHRGLERKQSSDFTLAGLALGFGLAFYLPIRLFAVLLVVIGAGLTWHWRARGWSLVKSLLPHLAAMILGALVAIAPVVEFALREPQVFFERNRSASIFYEREEPDLSKAIWNSAVKHLGMFNYQGDRNGRHNLPDAPMLDPLGGMLFMLGVGLAARHWRSAPNGVMLILFIGMLQAGILSTDFEAPQALRSIGVLPAVIYFIVLTLTALRATLLNLSPSLNMRVIANAVTLTILAVVAYTNLDTYFNKQANDPVVWSVHSMGETWTAREMNRLGDTHDIILSSRYRDSATIQFLAPTVKPALIWTADDRLPPTPVGNRPIAIFLDFTQGELFANLQRAYPAATFHALTPPMGGAPIAYRIIFNTSISRASRASRPP